MSDQYGNKCVSTMCRYECIVSNVQYDPEDQSIYVWALSFSAAS
jgi:hypothetical protein